MSEIYALPFNLIKISFPDTLPLVYIIRTVLIPKYSGLEGRDGGGRMSFLFLAAYIKFNLLFSIISIFRVTPHCFATVLSVLFCYLSHCMSQKIYMYIPHPVPRLLLCDHDTESTAIKSILFSLNKNFSSINFYNNQNLTTDF